MASKERDPKQETQHEKKNAASRKDAHANPSSDDGDIEQETQHEKRQAATKSGEK